MCTAHAVLEVQFKFFYLNVGLCFIPHINAALLFPLFDSCVRQIVLELDFTLEGKKRSNLINLKVFPIHFAIN